ncbi:hypothetical protein [Burkholderia sp. AW49-1]
MTSLHDKRENLSVGNDSDFQVSAIRAFPVIGHPYRTHLSSNQVQPSSGGIEQAPETGMVVTQAYGELLRLCFEAALHAFRNHAIPTIDHTHEQIRASHPVSPAFSLR